MRNTMYGAVGFTALALALFGTSGQAAAQESPNGSAASRAPSFHVNIPTTPSTKEVLQGTYINSGVAGISVPADTYTPIDNLLTVVCPGTTGTCSIQADMWVQNGGTGTSGNWNLVCLYVDGNPAPFCNYLADETLADGNFVNSTSSDIVRGLSLGNHTVQTIFYSFNGTKVFHHHSNFKVFKP